MVENIEKSGKVWISTTEVKGKMWFRINPISFPTLTEQMDQLLDLLEAECRAEIKRASAATR